MSPTLNLAMELIRCPSITPQDAGCQELLISRLEPLGFKIERLKYADVTNLWAYHGNTNPIFCFAGHTDVVPTGPLDAWHSNPFQPEIRDGLLYGRGAVDMKGGLAAMVTAAEAFVAENPQHSGTIAFLLTSDEEGPAIDGTIKVIELLQTRNTYINWCLLGEPSSTLQVGDTIKNGRRGSLNAHLKVLGKQGHIAAPPNTVKNPFHSSVAALNRLCTEIWDQGNEYFPPTSFQISNLQMGTGAENVVPGELHAKFNLRFSTALTANAIQHKITSILDQGNFDYEIQWQLSGKPFLSKSGELLQAASYAIKKITGFTPKLSTGGGTSDGRFIAPTGTQVIELGPVNSSAHQVNEYVGVQELDVLDNIYQQILEQLLISS
ncbi:succinyl-diaminopimelate desuccinylase [Achromatium sp. WMS3]|nr:succinyl-diaminopimelate desuccinylase [Achromatium sp. WMS3]